MEDDDRDLIYLGAGPLAAILLGMALFPLRGYTVASNFTFVFMALTILVAEFGGLWPAVATALCSSLSLDFFLTQPYLKLSIESKHDLIAFVGLTFCGLVAAAVGSRRSERASALRAARRQLDLLHVAVNQVSSGVPLDVALPRILAASRAALPLSAALVRDNRGSTLAATERDHAMPMPAQTLPSDAPQPAEGHERDRAGRGASLPREGGRLPLVAGNRQVGWLDVWGTGRPAREASRRVLWDLARLLAVLLARTDAEHGRGSGPE
jgi:two-component system sensor histidine kinase KdpD